MHLPTYLHPLCRYGTLIYAAAGLAACSPDSSPTGPVVTSPDGETSEGAVASAIGRPNIVVIMSDDQTMDDMRVMPQTRSLIGEAGLTFTNNVVTYALCCPSRATFLTGQYP